MEEKLTKKTAIFLGAGASCELGMPLVWELTSEIHNWLTPEKIHKLNVNWKKGNAGYSDETIKIVQEFLDMKDIHYEHLIGAIEVESQRTRGNNTQFQDLHGMKVWLLQLVYYLLYYRQTKNYSYINQRIKLYKGLTQLVEKSDPLWVFSLNHDILLELIVSKFNIPLKTGFNQNYLLKYKKNDQINEINLEYISRKDIDNNNYDFFKNGEKGINLIKLHGALDIFGKDDELNYVKLKNKSGDINHLINSLIEINEKAHYVPNNVNTTNEIMYIDENNELQFLRKSILSGVYKFKNSQVAPKEFFEAFKSNLNYSNILYVIGYSFSDSHVNDVFQHWLSFHKERKLIIVNPYGEIPSDIYYLKPQIQIIKKSFSEFLIDFSSEEEKRELLKIDKKYKKIRKFALSTSGQKVKKILEKIILNPILKVNKNSESITNKTL